MKGFISYKLKEWQEWLDLSTATIGCVCLTGDDDLGEDASKSEMK